MEKTESEGIAEQVEFTRLERRDWELWSIALLLLTVFAAGFFVYLLAEKTEQQVLSPGSGRFLWLLLMGMVVLVVLLNVYLIDRKRSLAQLRRRYLLQAELLEQEREQATRDPLTQVYNRRLLEVMVPKEARRCERLGRSMSFLVVDITDLKEVNQRLGHFQGDLVLQGVASVLQNTLRTTDSVFRFGGDEFLVVLPETPAEGAAMVEDRVRQRVSQNKELEEKIGRFLRLSIGRATYDKGKNVDAVIEEAARGAQEGMAARKEAGTG